MRTHWQARAWHRKAIRQKSIVFKSGPNEAAMNMLHIYVVPLSSFRTPAWLQNNKINSWVADAKLDHFVSGIGEAASLFTIRKLLLGCRCNFLDDLICLYFVLSFSAR